MKIISAFLKKFANDWTMNLASMLTYSLITTIFPLLLGILSIAGFILKFLPGSEFNQVVTSINSALPQNFKQVINMHQLLQNVVNISGPAAIISLVLLFFTGSNLFTSMENAFSIVFRVPDRDVIPQRLMGMGMVILLAVLLPLSLAASSLVTAGSKSFGSFLPGPLSILLTFIGPLVSLGILWVLFLCIYKIVPNTLVLFGAAARGALVSAILFGLLQILFPLYFKVALSGNAKYGAVAGSILVLGAWLWLFAVITMLGAQVTSLAMGLRPARQDVARTIARDYDEQLIAASPPKRRRRVPLPRARHVLPLASALSPVFSLTGRILVPVLRLIALAGWLVARPAVHAGVEARRRSIRVPHSLNRQAHH